MRIEEIATLITVLGIGSVIPTILNYIIDRKKKQDESEDTFTRVFRDVHEVYYSLLVMLRDSKAHRVVILKTTNGGGIPKLSGKLFSSVIYEGFEAPLKPVKQFWQGVELDHAYLDMLYEMNKTGRIELFTETMADGMLKDVYLAGGIKAAWIYRISEREKDYIYMSANFTEIPKSNPESRILFRTGVNKLKNLFKNDKI